ncbi:hypothetical protein Hypma_007422 [Hypsizygus marmoreus]|uniref:Uncharacterized protein n=1 Tax=Hypsizygus marmoreus TaxID=39966 RepID=A0A369JUR5_HYPMA|nr:hypothetical protein Hypma_007422 [Hypsizygus marmoreus]
MMVTESTALRSACESMSPRSRETDLPSTPASCDTSFSGSTESDEYTLTGFGDISLSNIYFVPSLPSDVSPRRTDSWSRAKTKEMPPPPVRKVPFHRANNPLPDVIQNIVQPSPSKAALSPKSDFEKLVASLRKSREHQSPTRATSGAEPQSPSKVVHAPQPRHAVNLKVIEKLSAQVNALGFRDGEDRVLIARGSRAQAMPPPSARIAAPKPKKERPLRGNARLPARPPLPRWDLHDPALTSPQADEQVATFGSTPGRMASTRRT